MPTSPRGAAPAWTKYPTYGYTRAQLLAYSEAEDRAYHRAQGIPFRRRTKPEIPASGRHPRSAYKHLPSIPAAIRNLRGQMDAL